MTKELKKAWLDKLNPKTKFKTNDIFVLTSELYVLGSNKKIDNIDYLEWVRFIDNHPDEFIWKEDTTKGKNLLKNIDKVPDSFRERVLASLNKYACYSEFDKSKGYYNIKISFNSVSNTINISFERKPKPEDFKTFTKMANHLNTLLIWNGNKIIDEKYLESLG